MWPSDGYATPWPQQRHRPKDAVDLLVRVLDALPRLDGAACRDCPPEWFDADRLDQAHQAAQALVICDRCPVLDRCQAWALSAPPGRLSGVVGGVWLLDAKSTAAQAS